MTDAYKLIFGIVPRGQAELLTRAAVGAGAGGGTVSRGTGTAANSLLQLFGLADSDKDIVYILSEGEKSSLIMNAMIKACQEKKRPFGVVFTVSVNSFFKAGTITGKEENMNESTHQLITLIVNKGFADDAMAAARKAGAGGGTILSARGTARPGDATFFGMEIVPEKEMILIVAENSKAEAIMEAVKNLDCLSKPGSGIAYSSPAGNFTVLGKSK